MYIIFCLDYTYPWFSTYFFPRVMHYCWTAFVIVIDITWRFRECNIRNYAIQILSYFGVIFRFKKYVICNRSLIEIKMVCSFYN